MNLGNISKPTFFVLSKSSMQTNFDAIVIGFGAMGSASVYQLAKRGVKVLGIDQFSPPHIYGSTHGETRITRLAIGEGAEYVPLVMRSHKLWREIENESGVDLMNQCGGLIIAKRNSAGTHHGKPQFLKQTISAAGQFNIKHEILSSEEIQKRFPQFNLTGDEEGYYEPTAGYLRPEKCVETQLNLAESRGAILKRNEMVLSYEVESNNSVTVKTDKDIYSAKKLIVSAGAWINRFIETNEERFKIYRQTLFWFEVERNTELYKTQPIFIWMFGEETEDLFYGFPIIEGNRIKVAREEFEAEITLENIKRDVDENEIKTVYENFVEGRLSGIGRNCVKASTCLYTQTPDSRFVIDFHPHYENVIIASPCSGHGFKHSAAIGEALAEMAFDGRSRIDISGFKLNQNGQDSYK